MVDTYTSIFIESGFSVNGKFFIHYGENVKK